MLTAKQLIKKYHQGIPLGLHYHWPLGVTTPYEFSDSLGRGEYKSPREQLPVFLTIVLHGYVYFLFACYIHRLLGPKVNNIIRI